MPFLTKEDSALEEVDRSGDEYDKWRLKVLTTLELFLTQSQQRNYDPDLLFNAAQTAARLKNSHLSLLLIREANRRKPADLAIKAALYSGIVDSGTPSEVDKAYISLLNLVPKVGTTKNPHIVLSEARNASADLSRFKEFLNALRTVEESDGQHIPSIVYAMQARILLEIPDPANLELAKEAMDKARGQLRFETISNRWVSRTREYIAAVQLRIKVTEQMRGS